MCVRMLSLLRLQLQRDPADPLTSSSYTGHAMFRGLHMQANTRHAHVGNLGLSAALAAAIEGARPSLAALPLRL